MKNSIQAMFFVALFAVAGALILGPRFLSTQPVYVTHQPFYSPAMGTQEVIIPYGQYHNRPVEIVYDSLTKHVTLRIFQVVTGTQDNSLSYLKSEVTKLTSKNTSTKIGSEYTLSYAGGYPLWGPYELGGPNNNYDCLEFSDSAKLVGRTLIIYGKKTKGSGYYGYPDNAGTALKE